MMRRGIANSAGRKARHVVRGREGTINSCGGGKGAPNRKEREGTVKLVSRVSVQTVPKIAHEVIRWSGALVVVSYTLRCVCVCVGFRV